MVGKVLVRWPDAAYYFKVGAPVLRLLTARENTISVFMCKGFKGGLALHISYPGNAH